MDKALFVPTIDIRKRIPDKTIRALVRRIVDEFHPDRIILFGSYAHGQPRPESDLDLLVIMDTQLSESEQAMQIRRQLNIMFGLDLLVYTPQRLAQRFAWGDSFLKEITEQEIVLYESTDARMGWQS